jgi:hypothetical protein
LWQNGASVTTLLDPQFALFLLQLPLVSGKLLFALPMQALLN